MIFLITPGTMSQDTSGKTDFISYPQLGSAYIKLVLFPSNNFIVYFTPFIFFYTKCNSKTE